jgi:hypothetical protein
MPSRVLRETILTSDAVDQLDFAAEVFYRRLMSVVDDFGRFDGRLSIIKAACYPLRLEKIREADISRWIAMCEKAGLLALYQVNSKPYVELFKLGKPRAEESKYPARSCAQVIASESIGIQMNTDVPYSDSGAYSDAKSKSRKRAADAASSQPGELPGFDSWWKEWPSHERKTGKVDCRKKWAAKRLEPIADQVIASLRRSKASRDWTKEDGAFIPQPLTWLNKTPWETDPGELQPAAPEGANGEYRDPTDDELAEYRREVAS